MTLRSRSNDAPSPKEESQRSGANSQQWMDSHEVKVRGHGDCCQAAKSARTDL